MHSISKFLTVIEEREEVSEEHAPQSPDSEQENSEGELQSLRADLEAVKTENLNCANS